ncbi:hypothetical protein H4Q32_018084 [Labeo rohita]|uniref:Reverse transcriptase domain-containing protein n=1 Tax=Labeo rohita TaxID=84645 RepID=A0ABQ8LBF8_LABRO|nr:hypothetical protein H4Q32_018084 [Labeo rohita]
MADADKVCFLDAPISQAGLFGDTVKDFAQQFSAVQKQTEAIKHILPRRESTKPPAAKSAPARRRGRLPAASTSAPPAEMKLGFYSPYFIVPKKNGGLRPILDLRHQDWFAAINLKDAYFHVSILPRHRPFLRFAFEGQAYQYKVLPFGLALSPRVFTELAEGALAPYSQLSRRLADSSSLARSVVRTQGSGASAPQSFGASGQLGEEQALPCAEHLFSQDGAELGQHDGTSHGRTCAVGARLSEVFQTQHSGPSKVVSGLLGHMAAAAALTPLGLLHMRPLQHWLHGRVPRWAWHRGTFRVGVTPECRHLFSPWSDLTFLRAGVPLGQVREHVIVNTDASSTGWVAVCNGQAASGSWTGPRLLWHINCLELLAVFLALHRFRRMLHGEHSEVAQVAHIPGELNRAADALSRQLTLPGEWRLHPQVVQLIWSRFGEAQIDLFASPESAHCQLFYSLTVSTPPAICLLHPCGAPSAGSQGAGQRTTEGERLSYNCNPRSLKEGTETLRPSCHNPELRWRCRWFGSSAET